MVLIFPGRVLQTNNAKQNRFPLGNQVVVNRSNGTEDPHATVETHLTFYEAPLT